MGSEWYVHVAMNRVIAKTPAVVRDILQQYDTRPEFDVVVDGDLGMGTLFVGVDEYLPNNDWPSAVPVDELPADDDDDEYFEAVEDLHKTKGEQGLTDLLLKLAPYLTGPLILQTADFSSFGEFGAAQEWTVQPGATNVECRKIVGFDNGVDLPTKQVTADGFQQKSPLLVGVSHAPP